MSDTIGHTFSNADGMRITNRIARKARPAGAVKALVNALLAEEGMELTITR